MCSLLDKIKSKYALKNVFDYMPYNLRLKIVYGAKKLFNNLNITIETYRKFYEVKKLVNPSCNIDNLIDYLNLEKVDSDNEKFIYGCLNNASFNVGLFIENEKWRKIVKYINNTKLMITPNMLNFIYDLDNENKQNIFNLLNLYKNNIVEISFINFNNKKKINFEAINQIIYILKNIFQKEIKDENAINNCNNFEYMNVYDIIKYEDNVQINEYHKIKKISLERNEFPPYLDITSKFFDKINEIISLNKIEDLFIDANSFNEFQFANFIKYIPKKIIYLKSINIINFGYKKSHYADFSSLCSNSNETIEKIDLGDSLCSDDILPILNAKNFPLKSLKLKLFSNETEFKWKFLENSINNLEIFEIEINGKNNHDNIEKIISTLNKMKKLKQLKMIGGISPNELFNLENKGNIQCLNIDINLLFNNVEIFSANLCNYFNNFINLKNLTLKNNDCFKITNNNIFFEFIFPPKLKSLYLINFEDATIIPLLKKNKQNLNNIEEFKLDSCHFTHENYSSLIDLFSCFKYLLKLSINKIDFKSSYKSLIEDISFFDYIPSILKNVPTLIELDLSDNNYNEKILRSKIFKEISLLIPKKLYCFNIFNREIPVTSQSFNYLAKLFGSLLYYDDNFPNINDKLIFPNDDDDENSFYDNYNSDYSDYELNQ